MIVHGAAARNVPDKDAVLFERIDQTSLKQLRRASEISHLKALAVGCVDSERLVTGMVHLREAVIPARPIIPQQEEPCSYAAFITPANAV